MRKEENNKIQWKERRKRERERGIERNRRREIVEELDRARWVAREKHSVEYHDDVDASKEDDNDRPCVHGRGDIKKRTKNKKTKKKKKKSEKRTYYSEGGSGRLCIVM